MATHRNKGGAQGASGRWAGGTPKMAAFLAAFAETGNVSDACRISGVSRQSHYRWLAANKGYAAAFGDAREDARDNLEREARRRAVEGVEKPLYYQGKPYGTTRTYSDTLLIFLM